MPPGLKPALIPDAYAALEGPLFPVHIRGYGRNAAYSSTPSALRADSCKQRAGRGTLCVADAGEIRSDGHSPAAGAKARAD
jgi:hypothetical protein